MPSNIMPPRAVAQLNEAIILRYQLDRTRQSSIMTLVAQLQLYVGLLLNNIMPPRVVGSAEGSYNILVPDH
jgi:hypothetical protein